MAIHSLKSNEFNTHFKNLLFSVKIWSLAKWKIIFGLFWKQLNDIINVGKKTNIQWDVSEDFFFQIDFALNTTQKEYQTNN